MPLRVAFGEPPSSVSSLISSSLLVVMAGDAVCKGNAAAKDVSFRSSPDVISNSVSYGVNWSRISEKCTVVRAAVSVSSVKHLCLSLSPTLQQP